MVGVGTNHSRNWPALTEHKLACLIYFAVLNLISGFTFCNAFLCGSGEPQLPPSPKSCASNLNVWTIKASASAKIASGNSEIQLAATFDGKNSHAQDELNTKKRQILDLLKNNKLLVAYNVLCETVAAAERTNNRDELFQVSRNIDQIFQAFTKKAFLEPYREQNARRRIMIGMNVLSLQLSSSLATPYNTIPKRVYLDALRAVTVINESQHPAANRGNTTFGNDSSYSAFRILQRLVSGVGVRGRDAKTGKYSNANLQEKDFNMVLNSFSNVGKMEMAHRVVALQERTENAPPLSPVAYSILLKGYGRLRDLRNVEMTAKHAQMNDIVPDTIMLNSLIDAYVNCQAIGKAKSLFYFVTNREGGASFDQETFQFVQGDGSIPEANRRTYNIMLKGLANEGSLEECLQLSQKIQELGMWDTVTTNTLVHAAVLQKNFTIAEKVLSEYTVTAASVSAKRNRRQRHPNVEGYTALVDGYSKAGDLKKALEVLQTMKGMDVEPTEVTYTCLVAAFARQGRFDKARAMMDYMEKIADLKPGVVTYNAFISGVLSDCLGDSERKSAMERDFSSADSTDEQVNEALRIFYSMMKAGIPPNEVAVAMIVLAMGGCRPAPRIDEAKALVSRLESNGIIDLAKSEKITTAMVQACGYGGDIKGVLESYQKLKRPDLIALNTFLDACCRCSNYQAAMKTFYHYFGRGEVAGTSALKPDVITFSILICVLLRKDTFKTSLEAGELYDRMKEDYSTLPDKPMVDQVLKTIIRGGKLQKKDIPLVARIVRDAEKMKWGPNQLERRKRAIQEVLSSRSGLDVWGDEDDNTLRQAVKSEDLLFKRKGWNSVDSGFRLWGRGCMEIRERDDACMDKFLESKGWNNVDSGFRIF